MPSESSTIKVVTRVRPLTSEEDAKNVKSVVRTEGDKTLVSHSGKDASFSFESSYPSSASHKVIFQSKVESQVKRALEGYNVSILAFGATGSGKSYTMTGTDADPGLIPLVNERVFKHVADKTDKDFLVTVSFVDIMEDALTDLLNPHTRDMHVRPHPYKSIYVEGLSEMVVRSIEDIRRLYEQGVRARMGGADDVSAHRQRSSSVFTITIEQKDKKTSRFGVRATISLADLCGIEGAADGKTSNGTKALLAVLSSLGDSKNKGGHVPYRNSLLTRLLQESLGGNSFTLFLATLSPSERDVQQTLQTLQYCQYAQSIKNTVRLNLDETSDIISELRNEISKQRQKITSSSESDRGEVIKLQELIRDLDVAKKQTWAERDKISLQFEQERKINLTNKGMYEWVMDSMNKGTRALREKIVVLQKEKDQLSIQCKEKRDAVDTLKDQLQKMIADYSKFAESGKLSESETKKKVSAIHEAKERLKREGETLKTLKQQLKEVDSKLVAEIEGGQSQISSLKGNTALREKIEIEERQQLEQRNKALISEELDKMKIDVETQKAEIQMRAAEGRQYSTQEGAQLESSLLQVKAETSVVTLQLELLKQERGKLKEDLASVYAVHRDDIEVQQLQHFQTFREYREMFEEQKQAIESRYRNLLQDCVQDAVFLSTRNNELQQENQAQRQKIAEMKDTICQLESTKGQNA